MNHGQGMHIGLLLLVGTLAMGGANGFTEETTSDRFERPGVIADRRERIVRVEAVATGLDKSIQTEFILIGPKSGHDYEAAAISRAAPSDVHAALEFIGLRPGRPYNPARLSFWARGPRVEVFVEWDETDADGKTIRRRAHAEEAIVDRRTNQCLPPMGFVFTGSVRVKQEDESEAYAADTFDPMAILPAFNETTAVLDIPRQGSKEELYDFQYMNGALGWREKQPLVFEFRPARPDGPPFESNARLHFAPDGGDGVAVELTINGATSGPHREAEAIADALHPYLKADTRVFAAISFAEDLALKRLGAAAALVQQLSDRDIVRVEPPPDGELFYRAFLPNPAFRERARRPAQPWELRLRRTENGGLTGDLIRVTRKSDEADGPPEFVEERFAVPTPEALRTVLNEQGSGGLSVILVFAPGDLPYAVLRQFVRPALSTHPIVYFFAE